MSAIQLIALSLHFSSLLISLLSHFSSPHFFSFIFYLLCLHIFIMLNRNLFLGGNRISIQSAVLSNPSVALSTSSSSSSTSSILPTCDDAPTTHAAAGRVVMTCRGCTMSVRTQQLFSAWIHSTLHCSILLAFYSIWSTFYFSSIPSMNHSMLNHSTLFPFR